MTHPTRLVSTAARRMGQRSTPPTMVGTPDVDVLRGVEAQLAGIRNGYRQDLETRRRAILADQNLTLAGQDAAQAALKQELAQTYGAQLDALGQQAVDAMNRLHMAEANARPGPEPGVEAQLARQSERGDVERQYNAGVSLDRLIAVADDAEDCWAIVDEAPVLMRMRGTMDPEVIEPYVWAAIRKIHELEGTLPAFDAARAGETIVAGLAGAFDLARTTLAGEIAPGNGLAAAVGAKLAQQAQQARTRGIQPNVWDGAK